MKTRLIGFLVQAIIGALPANVVKKALDALLDKVEDAVRDSANKIDDVTILPLCNLIRSALDIPDND